MSLPKAPRTASEVRYLMADRLSSPVGTPAMAEVDRELTPLLAELLTLGPGNDQHTCVRQLFNWLVDPHHTAEEFSYVIGPLERHVYGIMEGHFKQYVYATDTNIDCSVYLCKIAAEALAVRCPVLEGPWETVAWFVTRLSNDYFSHDYGVASDRLSIWVISVIGDPDLCPRSYLRIELMHLLLVMVDINEKNMEMAFNSIMSGCSTLTLDYLTGGAGTDFFNMSLDSIGFILEMFSSQTLNGYIYEVDRKLVNKLKHIRESRIKILLNDVACNHAVNPSIHKEPIEFDALNAILESTLACVQREYKLFQEDGNYNDDQNCLVFSNMLGILFDCFRLTLHSPCVIETSASSIMDLVELVLMLNVSPLAVKGEIYCLHNTERLLVGLYGPINNISTSPSSLGRKIFYKYLDSRIRNLRIKLQHCNFSSFPIISDFLYYNT